ncbi:hypothetical protein [Flavobacterium aestivum]|uniref:hypothetical protein n=1 Tax=Flavobacterium aestivum TaxID=3003257 RepID=UPI0022866305|nr:hypothetical protein [Flavobacterium aestivum]
MRYKENKETYSRSYSNYEEQTRNHKNHKMNEVSIFRLYLLRATYLLISVGLGFTIWPQIIQHPTPWPLWHGVGCSLLGAVSILAFLGIHNPLKMLPILFFELIWKSIWLITIALPLWLTGQMDSENLETAQNCLMGIIVPLVIPWPYVWKHYVETSRDRWK